MRGYDVQDYNNARDYTRKGITDKVTRYVVKSRDFPNITIINDKSKPLGKHKIPVFSAMVSANKDITEDEANNLISLYVSDSGRTVKLGTVMPSQIKSLLMLCEDNLVEGYLNESTKLEGDYLYVLSS